jgi:uncharacterized integral membrane protein
MKLFKMFFGLIIILLILFFLIRNNDTTDIDLIYKSYPDVQVALVLLGALAVGILIGYIMAVTTILSSKNEVRILRSEMRELSDELDNLRNVAIEEGAVDLLEED